MKTASEHLAAWCVLAIILCIIIKDRNSPTRQVVVAEAQAEDTSSQQSRESPMPRPAETGMPRLAERPVTSSASSQETPTPPPEVFEEWPERLDPVEFPVEDAGCCSHEEPAPFPVELTMSESPQGGTSIVPPCPDQPTVFATFPVPDERADAPPWEINFDRNLQQSRFLRLPDEILLQILLSVATDDLYMLRQVSFTFWRIYRGETFSKFHRKSGIPVWERERTNGFENDAKTVLRAKRHAFCDPCFKRRTARCYQDHRDYFQLVTELRCRYCESWHNMILFSREERRQYLAKRPRRCIMPSASIQLCPHINIAVSSIWNRISSPSRWNKHLATFWVQSIYYGLAIRAGDPKPQPGSAKYAIHRRRIYILVVSVYLLYTLIEADHTLRRQGTFYTDLDVAASAPVRIIKSRFRRLAAVYHPDKQTGDSSAAAARFMHLKTASETLSDPNRRFAYERFGPVVGNWQHCKTVYDFVSAGVFSGTIPHYGIAAAATYGLGLLGYLDWGRYWRWVVLLTFFVAELIVVTRPEMPPYLAMANTALSTILRRPPYLQFQLVSLARQAAVTMYIAFSQIGPLLNPQGQAAQRAAEGSAAAVDEGLQRLENLVRGLDGEANRLLDMEMTPFMGDKEALSSVRAKVKDWLVQNTIRADPMVRDAMGNSFRKRRVDAPAGAKGNRT
ncbi:DnaJ domain-containing protein [Colletotrichum camelliae]|nr:DnaJ domain-containing protein [Colletotrichum camelliae]